MSLLSPAEIKKLHESAVSFGLAGARLALLRGIDPAAVKKLPAGLREAEQILSDLTEMNRLRTLPDGSIPLRVWLWNAISLAPSRFASETFRKALAALDRALIEAAQHPEEPILEASPPREPAHADKPKGFPTEVAVPGSEAKPPPPSSVLGSKAVDRPVLAPAQPEKNTLGAQSRPATDPAEAAAQSEGPGDEFPAYLIRFGDAFEDTRPRSGGEDESPGVGEGPERIVSTGFSAAESPGRPLSGGAGLEPGGSYYYWLEVGAPVAGSIERTPSRLPAELLPKDAELTVVLFSNPGGLELDPAADIGVLRLRPDGHVLVTRPASVPPPIAQMPELLATRLFFPVKAPAAEGDYLLRSCIYYRGTLVQSREVRARVARGKRAEEGSLSSRVDYTLSRSLAPRGLRALGEHKLSILLNAAEDGTHGFRFFGEGDYRKSASFDGHEVQSHITRVRESMRRVSWGSADAWTPSAPYRYDQLATFQSLLGDLIDMAKAGFRVYDAIADRLGGGSSGADALRETMRRPGLVQLALKESSRLVLPLAMLYDHPIDTWLKPDAYKLCEAFIASTADGGPLEDKACFLGDCPSRDDARTVCPSGFWGFRHAIGVPVTLASGRESPPDLDNPLPRGEGPRVTVAVCTDPQMRERDRHVQALLALFDPARARLAETRDAALQALRETTSHVVYFYCHGGVDGGVPYIQVGPMDGPPIGRDTLRREKIAWSSPRSLVFINGCHTTDLEPERAIDLVSGFVETAGASGVIGTEITVFEPLATAFAESFMDAFLRGGRPVGEAVRRARLHLLQKDLNPLGLVYVPFAVASLKLS